MVEILNGKYGKEVECIKIYKVIFRKLTIPLKASKTSWLELTKSFRNWRQWSLKEICIKNNEGSWNNNSVAKRHCKGK